MTPTETALSTLFGTGEAARDAGMAALAVMEQEVAQARGVGDFRAASAIASVVSAIAGLAAVQMAEERELSQ